MMLDYIMDAVLRPLNDRIAGLSPSAQFKKHSLQASTFFEKLLLRLSVNLFTSNYLPSTSTSSTQPSLTPQPPTMISTLILSLLAQTLLIPTITAETINVAVGENNLLTFTPPTVSAQPGDTVAFNFQTANHSVVSSDQNSPCLPLPNAIFSGFQPVNKDDENKPTFSVPIKDTNPIYIYCSQGNHCQKGMVMVINPPNATAQLLFAAKAQMGGNLSPPGGVSGGSVTNGATGS